MVNDYKDDDAESLGSSQLENRTVVTIFNRFSKLLKVIRYGDEAWDGTYNGIELPSDDYWFVIEYVNGDGVVVNFKSHFALIR